MTPTPLQPEWSISDSDPSGRVVWHAQPAPDVSLFCANFDRDKNLSDWRACAIVGRVVVRSPHLLRDLDAAKGLAEICALSFLALPHPET